MLGKDVFTWQSWKYRFWRHSWVFLKSYLKRCQLFISFRKDVIMQESQIAVAGFEPAILRLWISADRPLPYTATINPSLSMTTSQEGHCNLMGKSLITGRLGLEPRTTVLETAVLPVKLTTYRTPLKKVLKIKAVYNVKNTPNKTRTGTRKISLDFKSKASANSAMGA